MSDTEKQDNTNNVDIEQEPEKSSGRSAHGRKTRPTDRKRPAGRKAPAGRKHLTGQKSSDGEQNSAGKKSSDEEQNSAGKKSTGAEQKAAGKKSTDEEQNSAGKKSTGTGQKAAGKKSTGAEQKAAGKKSTDEEQNSAGKKSTGTGQKAAGKKRSAGEKAPDRKKASAGRKDSARKRPAGKNTGRRRKKRAVRRKETAFQKYFQQIGGAIAFILLVVTTVLTGRTVTAGRTNVPVATENVQMELPDDSTVAAVEAAVQITPTPLPTPTERPAALPIEDYVPEQDCQGFFTNGIATTDGQAVTILCGGDNLIHEPIYQKAATATGYDFNYLYANLKSFIQSADIATINQEAPLATDISEPSGYPHFNTPKEVGQALFNSGFDVINIANNHIYDIGSEGASVTEQYFQNRGIPVVGFYRNESDYENIRVINCNGIKVAFLSFVEYTNLDPDDPDLGFVVTMDDSDRVKEQIQLARNVADIVVAHAHWGDEGTTELTDTQVYMANLMVDWGVDIIYGNHPHVIQQLTTITRESDNQICPVIYSMGNFVSAQTHRNQIVSAMLAVKVTRDANGVPRPTAMGVMPVITHYTQEDRMDVILYPLANYTEDMARAHRVNATDGEFSMDYIYGLLNESIPDRYLNRMSSLTSE